MRTKIIYSIIVLLFAFVACEKQSITNKNDENALANFLTHNQKYQKLKNQTKKNRLFGTFKKMKSLKSFKSDSLEDPVDPFDSLFPEESCVKITQTKNEDGSFTLIMDYGEEGCEEYGVLIKGKITMTWKTEGGKYYFEESFENYYMNDVTINGKSIFEDTWNANEDSTNYDYSWTGEEKLKFAYDNGEIVEMTGKFKENGKPSSYTVLEGSYSYESSLGYTFSYEVTKPLVYNYSCTNVYIPVEGTEKVNYVENGKSEEFVMDYGEGTCDNKYTITIDGVTEEFNYDNEWYTDVEEIEWDNSDSSSVSGS